MERGARIDPVNLLPISRRSDPDNTNIDNARLQSAVKDIALVNSEEGRRVLGLIKEKLQNRIEALIRADPEANAYEQLMADMGLKYNIAKTAVRKLAERHIKDLDDY